MNTLEAISKRRSIRRFAAGCVTEEQLNTLLSAAMAAPTARNKQEWEFIVIKDRHILTQIMNVHPYAQMLHEADCAIAICGNTQREHAPGYWIADCGSAAQNLLLAGTELGLGAVWLGVYPNTERMEGISKLLKLPAHVKPLNLIALGIPAETPIQVNRFDPAKVHLDTW